MRQPSTPPVLKSCSWEFPPGLPVALLMVPFLSTSSQPHLFGFAIPFHGFKHSNSPPLSSSISCWMNSCPVKTALAELLGSANTNWVSWQSFLQSEQDIHHLGGTGKITQMPPAISPFSPKYAPMPTSYRFCPGCHDA